MITIEQIGEWKSYGTLAGIALVALAGQWNARKARKEAKHAKAAADGVAVSLKTSDEQRDAKLRDIHDLVNGAMVEANRVNMMQSRRIAALTKDPADIALAEQAQKDYEQAAARQVRVDVALAKSGAG